MNDEYLSKEEAFRTIHGLLDEDDRNADDQDEP